MAHAHLFRYSCEAFPLPSLSPPLPHLLHQERHRMKQLLAAQELVFPRVFASLQAAMKPLMARSTTGLESNRYTSVVMTATVTAYAPHHVHAAPNTHCRACQDNPGPLPSSELNWTDPGEGSD